MRLFLKPACSLCLIVAVLLLFSSCSKKAPQKFTIDQMLSEIEVDLTKIKKDVKAPAEDLTAVENLKTSGLRLSVKIDSLLSKYPDSFFLYSFKIYQNNRQGADSMFALAAKEFKKDTTNLLRRYFYAVLHPDTSQSIPLLEKFINDHPDNYLGYFGLAQKLMERNPNDLTKPAKLTYLALLKENHMDEPYYLLSDIFSRLNREDDNAALNGIMLVNNPASEKAFFNILTYYGKKGEKEKAVDLLETFRKNNPEKLRDLDMAYYLVELKFYQAAEKYLAKVDGQGEDKLYAFYLGAKISVGLNNRAEAVKKVQQLANAITGQESYLITDPDFSDYFSKDKVYIGLVKKVEGNAPTLGDKAPELSGKILNGVDFIPQSLTGKVYLIDFWATWCSPCRAEMPNVKSVYNELHPEGFEVIGVNMDTNREAVIDYTKSTGIKWLHIYSGDVWKEANAQKYQVKGIPATYLVDKKGIIRYKGIRGRDLLMEKVKKLLAEV